MNSLSLIPIDEYRGGGGGLGASIKDQVKNLVNYVTNNQQITGLLFYYLVTLEGCPSCEKAMKLFEENEIVPIVDSYTKETKDEYVKSVAKMTNNYTTFPMIFEFYASINPLTMQPIFIGGYDDLVVRLSDDVKFDMPKVDERSKKECKWPDDFGSYISKKYGKIVDIVEFDKIDSGAVTTALEKSRKNDVVFKVKGGSSAAATADSDEAGLGYFLLYDKKHTILEIVNLSETPVPFQEIRKSFPKAVILTFDAENYLEYESMLSSMLYIDVRIPNMAIEKNHMIETFQEKGFPKEKKLVAEFFKKYFLGVCSNS